MTNNMINSNIQNSTNKTYQDQKNFINILDPYFVTGVMQRHATLSIFPQKVKIGVSFRFSIAIKINAENIALAHALKSFFKVGNIYQYEKSVIFSVTKLTDFVNVIIPHFKLYPIFGVAQIYLNCFFDAITIIANKPQNNIISIVEIYLTISKTHHSRILEAFPIVKPKSIDQNQVICTKSILNDFFICGFLSISGNYDFNLDPHGGFDYDVYFRALPIFSFRMSQDLSLARALADYLQVNLIIRKSNTYQFNIKGMEKCSNFISIIKVHRLSPQKQSEFNL